MKDVYNIGQEKSNALPNLPFPNNLFALLFKICEF